MAAAGTSIHPAVSPSGLLPSRPRRSSAKKWRVVATRCDKWRSTTAWPSCCNHASPVPAHGRRPPELLRRKRTLSTAFGGSSCTRLSATGVQPGYRTGGCRRRAGPARCEGRSRRLGGARSTRLQPRPGPIHQPRPRTRTTRPALRFSLRLRQQPAHDLHRSIRRLPMVYRPGHRHRRDHHWRRCT
jgi:hypothetical protein